MANIIIEDYETELENFMQKLAMNRQVLEKYLDNSCQQLEEIGQHNYHASMTDIVGDQIPEIAKKIVSARKDADAVRNNKDRAEKENQKLKQDYDNLNMHISEKILERDYLKEELAQTERRLEEKKRQIELDELRHKEKISSVEKGMLLYQTHLGLKLQRTKHNTLVFIFTQIDRLDPGKEHMLELTLKGNVYHLISSEPPLPNMRELEERLNASNNLSACFVHIRKLFQKMCE